MRRPGYSDALMTYAFSGVRILDFTQGVAGPLGAMHLADFGADVLKIEPPVGDRMGAHPGYLTWNRNKRVVTLDLETYAGLRDAKTLIGAADVAVFDAQPGRLERLGLDGTTLTAQHPRLLHVSMPSFGEKGRWSQLPPDELLFQAVSGVAFMQMSFEDQPVALVTPQVGYGHAAILANGIAAGLLERARSGRGQAVVISGLHGLAGVEAGAVSANRVIRMARSSRGGAPNYRLYRCADGEWFFLGCLTAPFFLHALEVIDLLELMALPGVEGDLSNLLANPALALEAQTMLEERFAERPRHEWMELLGDAGVPKGPVGDRDDWFRGETVAANEMRLVLDHPKHGPVEMPGVSVKLSDTPGSVRGFAQPTTIEEALAAWPAREAAPTADGERARPLEGVRVLDLGAFIAGTFAPTVLANYGADVIKIEPTGGDPFRTYGLGFVGYNLGKRSLTIDIKAPAGRRVFEELVRQSDVVLDNFRVGVRERLDIDYATLSALNPRVITCSVTGYGPEGPLALDPGFDPLLQARSGMMAAQGGADEPIFHQIPVNDTGSAMMAAFGIQAALHARELTGRGQEVQTSLANSTVLFQSGELTRYEGAPAPPVGGVDFLGVSALRRYYRCSDGWIVLACTKAEEFHRLAIALGHPEWAGRTIAEKALAEPGDGQLANGIAEALATMERDDVVDRLLTANVPGAAAHTAAETFESPWLWENGYFQRVEDPMWGEVVAPRSYADWGRSASGFTRRAPLMGEHSVEVLGEFGVGAAEIAALIGDNIVVQH